MTVQKETSMNNESNPEFTATPPPSAQDLLQGLEARLRETKEPIELWFDEDLPGFCADGELGDDLAQALTNLLTQEQPHE
jgi:hypothetical protein